MEFIRHLARQGGSRALQLPAFLGRNKSLQSAGTTGTRPEAGHHTGHKGLGYSQNSVTLYNPASNLKGVSDDERLADSANR